MNLDLNLRRVVGCPTVLSRKIQSFLFLPQPNSFNEVFGSDQVIKRKNESQIRLLCLAEILSEIFECPSDCLDNDAALVWQVSSNVKNFTCDARRLPEKFLGHTGGDECTWSSGEKIRKILVQKLQTPDELFEKVLKKKLSNLITVQFSLFLQSWPGSFVSSFPHFPIRSQIFCTSLLDQFLALSTTWLGTFF